jgi:anti-sigma factor RsiW
MNPACEQVVQRLSEYLDGELAVPALNRLRTHLRLCPRCAEEFFAIRSAVRLARWAMKPEQPECPATTDRLAARIVKRVVQTV